MKFTPDDHQLQLDWIQTDLFDFHAEINEHLTHLPIPAAHVANGAVGQRFFSPGPGSPETCFPAHD